MKGFLFLLTALAASFLLNAGMMSVIPIMNYQKLRQHGNADGKPVEAKLVALPILQKKKEKPQSEQEIRKVAKKSIEPGKSLARQRFVMDLGVGGQGSGSEGAAAISDANLQQISYEEGETDLDAKPLRQSAPRMPKQAQSAGVGGLVRCILTIGENGNVVDVQFLETPGNYGFEEAVREAVAEWEYKPAEVGGIPVRQKIEQPFKF